MKRILFGFFLAICFVGVAQTFDETKTFAYTIKGVPIDFPQDTEVMVIFFNSSFCHDCMVSLAKYVVNWSNEAPNRKYYVMVGGSSIGVMRPEASASKSFFQDGQKPNVVFDLNPIPELRYERKYSIYPFPCLLQFDKEGNCTYHSFIELFGEEP